MTAVPPVVGLGENDTIGLEKGSIKGGGCFQRLDGKSSGRICALMKGKDPEGIPKSSQAAWGNDS